MGGLGMHPPNATAAAAAAAATTAALQTLARNAAATGDAALGMQAAAALAANHQLPPLAPGSAALQSLSNEINASLLSNGERCSLSLLLGAVCGAGDVSTSSAWRKPRHPPAARAPRR